MATQLADYILVTEVARGHVLGDSVFQYKYRDHAPDSGYHFVALYRDADCWRPASYINYFAHRDAMLVRGACTDGRVLRAMQPDALAAVESAGGLMLQLVRYAEARFEDESVGTFGHCGDERSWVVLSSCGYVRLDHPYLIVRWNREPAPAARDELIDSVREIAPF